MLLWVLEYRESQEVSGSIDIKVLMRNVSDTKQILREILQAHGFDSELRMISQSEGDARGTLTYSVDMSPIVSIDQLSEEILTRDSANVESIEWDEKKSYSYMYSDAEDCSCSQKKRPLDNPNGLFVLLLIAL